MNHSTPQEIAQAINDLASIPEICSRLLQLLNREDSSLEEIATLIQSDPGLTARVLRLANSPFYNRGRSVANLNQAMMVVGTQSVVTLVLASCSVQSLSRLQQTGFDLHRFWEHSVFASLIARDLALRHRRCADDQAFLAGLLHDAGLLGMVSAVPDIARLMEMKRKTWQGPTYQIEETYLGFHHGHVGAELLRRWYFPEPLAIAVENHHQFDPRAGEAGLQHTLIVADALAHHADMGRGRSKEPVDWPEESLQALALEDEIIDEVLQGAREQLDTMLQFIMQPARAA